MEKTHYFLAHVACSIMLVMSLEWSLFGSEFSYAFYATLVAYEFRNGEILAGMFCFCLLCGFVHKMYATVGHIKMQTKAAERVTFCYVRV